MFFFWKKTSHTKSNLWQLHDSILSQLQASFCWQNQFTHKTFFRKSLIKKIVYLLSLTEFKSNILIRNFLVYAKMIVRKHNVLWIFLTLLPSPPPFKKGGNS